MGYLDDLEANHDVDGLIQYLPGWDPDRAIVALGEIGDPKAVKPLVSMLNKPGGAKKSEQKRIWDALVKIGAPGVEVLIQELQDGNLNYWVFGQVAGILADIKDERGMHLMIQILGTSGFMNHWKKLWAVASLGDMGNTAAVEPLIRALLEEGDWQVRRATALALGKLHDPRAVEPLIQALSDKKREVNVAAIEALVEIGEPSVEPLLNFLKCSDGSSMPSYRTCQDACTVLAQIGDQRAVSVIIDWLRRREVFKQQHGWLARLEIGQNGVYVRAFAEIGSPAVTPLKELLQDENKNMRKIAEAALKRISS